MTYNGSDKHKIALFEGKQDKLTAGDNITLTPLSDGTVQIDASGGGASALDDLTDVSITTPAAGQVLTYDGSDWINANSVHVSTMPAATSAEEGKIYQYIGETDSNYTNGYFYKCISSSPEPTYADPNGNLHKYYTVVSGDYAQWAWYKVFADKKICYCKVPNSDYYYFLGITNVPNKGQEAGEVNTAQNTTTSHIITLHPDFGYDNYDGNYLIFQWNDTTPTRNNALRMTASYLDPNIYIAESLEDAYAYLTRGDYEWVRIDVQPSQPGGVIDVEVDGVSVVTDGVAEIDLTDYAKTADLGTAASKDVGVANGVAELGSDGKVPSAQLPSYVDDVLEYASKNAFPATGESGKIYIALDTNKTYRWSGSAYVEISESLALGETSSTAYRGDRGKTAYNHATETKAGQTASGLYKVASTAQGHIASLTAVEKADITALGIPAQDTTYNDATQSVHGLMSTADKTKLDGIESGAQVNTVTSVAGKTGAVTLDKTDVGLGNVPNVTTDNQTPTVTEASTRTNLATGDTLKTIIGKIKKFFSDLKAVAFSGSYNDLSDTPTIPTVGNGTVTITQNGTTIGDFSMNQSGDETIALTDENVKATVTNPTTSNSYYIPWRSSSGISGVNTNDGLRYRTLEGVANTEGLAQISIGNSVAKTAAGNKTGKLVVYGANTGYSILQYKNTNSNNNFYLPVKSGTASVFATLPSASDRIVTSDGTAGGIKDSGITASEITDLKNATTELEDVTTTDTTSLEGNPLNFTTKSAQYAQDCNIEMNPIQDLHGYGKPWVGGAGKNKLRMSVSDVKSANTGGTWTGNAYATNGITYTIITDSDGYCIGAKARGKATSDAYLAFLFNESSVPAGNYYYSGCPSGGSNSTYDLFGWDRDTSARAKQWDGTTNVVSDFGDGNSQIKVVSGGRYLLRFRMKANYDSSSADVIVYPMLRLSTETDKTWQPYENICPIYPYTSLDVEMVGKNLFGSYTETTQKSTVTYTQSTGTYEIKASSTTSSNSQVTYTIDAKPFVGKQIRFSITGHSETSGFKPYVVLYKNGVTAVGNLGAGGSGITTNSFGWTVTSDTETLVFVFRLNHGGSVTADDYLTLTGVMLEIGSSATTFAPYQQSVIPISFDPIEPYGGTIDVRTGKLVVDRAIVDIGDLEWSYSASESIFYNTTLTNKKTGNHNIISSAYSTTTAVAIVNMVNGEIKGHASQVYVYIKDSRYTNASTFKTALTGQKIVYELATPQTYYLSPHEVNLLLAVNNVRAWAINTTQSIKDTAYCLFKNIVYRNGVMASLADVMWAVESVKKDWITSGSVWSKTSGENAVLVHELGSKYQDYAISCVIASTDYETYGFFFEITNEKYKYIQELDASAHTTFALDNIVAKHLITNRASNIVSSTIVFADGTSIVPEHCTVYIRIYKR